MATSATNEYTVFISHAGEDKATIAIPLREKLRSKGVTAFVDEADMPPGTNAANAMITAMETADIGVIVLSPEFVARKWPMKELLCFLHRRKEAQGTPQYPVIIPFFYRLSIAELYDEPRLDRVGRNGENLYASSRFLERMSASEPEANIATIKAALQELHGIMGLRNDVDASNDSTYLMNKRRNILLQELCDKVTQAVPEEKLEKVPASEIISSKDSFRVHYHRPQDTSKLVLSFFGKDDRQYADIPEGQLLETVLDLSLAECKVIALHGIGGVGKTSVLRGLSSLERVKERFKDGVYMMSLGMEATQRRVIVTLSQAVEASGGKDTADKMRAEKDLHKVAEDFRTWFAEKQCLFMVDDVWENSEILSGVIHKLLLLHGSGQDSKVLLTTRSILIASRADMCIGLEPREPLHAQARAILIQYSGIKAQNKAVEDILQSCCGLPLFLAIAGKAVRTLSFRRGCRGAIAYEVYASTVETHMQSFVNTDVDSYERLQSTLSISIGLLEERRNLLGFGVPLATAEMHRRLSVLEKQEKVPMSMLRHLWELKSEAEAAVVAREFEQIALADMEIEEEGSGYKEVLRLHDSLHLFASGESRRHGDAMSGHEAVVKGYGDKLNMMEGCREWWSPELKGDDYIHAHLCRHLVACGRLKEAVELLLHPQWTARMFCVSGITELERDFSLCISLFGDAYEEASEEVHLEGRQATNIYEEKEIGQALALLSEAAGLSSAYIAENFAEFWFQLHGRLKMFAVQFRAIGKYVDRIEKKGPTPWVRAVNGFLTEPGNVSTFIFLLGVPLRCLAVINDGKKVACGCRDGRIVVVDLTRREPNTEWQAHEEEVLSIVTARDGTRLVSGSSDGSAKVWDINTYLCVAVYEGHTDIVNCVADVGDGKRVLSGCYEGVVHLWDVDTGCLLSQPWEAVDGSLECMAVLADGEHVVTGGTDNTLRLWNITNGDQVGPDFVGHDDEIQCVASSADGHRIVSGSDDVTSRIWDVESHVEIGTLAEGHALGVTSVAVSTNGKEIISGSADNVIRVWDAEAEESICGPLEGHGSHVTGLSFLPGCDSVVSCSQDGTLRVWDLRRRSGHIVANRHEFFVSGVSFTPDGKYIVSSSWDKTLRIWDATSGQQIGDPLFSHEFFIEDVVVTPNGLGAVSASGWTVQVWDLSSWEQIRTLTGHKGTVTCVALTPRGDRVVTGSADKTVRIWDLEADRDTIVHEGHTCSVSRVFVTDDGRFAVSIDEKDEAFVWEISTSKLVLRTVVKGLQKLSRKEVMEILGEETYETLPPLSIPLGDRKVIYRDGRGEHVLATLEADVMSWALSPDHETICLGLTTGHVALLKLQT